VREAFRHALVGRPGPAYLEFPVDVLRDEIDERELHTPGPARYRPTPGAPDPAKIDHAADLLAQASFPLILAGQGVLRAEASQDLLDLVEYAGAAAMTSVAARGVIAEDHSNLIGAPLLSPGGARAAREADVVLAVGTEVGETLGYGRPPRWGEYGEQLWIQLDIDPLSIGVNRDVDLALVGDAKAGLVALNEAVRARSARRELPEQAAACVKLERDLLAQILEGLGSSDAEPIHPGRLASEVANFFPDDAIACFDGGNTALWAFLCHRMRAPRSMLWTGHFGHLGTGPSYAIAAKLAQPDRPVYLFTGDSAFGFNIAELETAKREGTNLVVVVACDYAWAMEALGQQQEMGRTLNLETSPARYDEIARGFGCHGEFVQRPDEIRPALERAASADRPAVVHVEVDPADNVSPPFLEAFLEMYAAHDS
jgi:acetolactate synthase-1/2/3 large subunit